jgi:hypothetical protein
VGNFKNAGQVWSREPTAVNVHDYPHDALGRAVPYGVYDVTNDRGFIWVGTSGDTPAFAADTITAWWQTEGQDRFAGADHLLLMADAGGSNSCQTRAWKERLQVQMCDRFGLTVTVCHYPTGCSKWNPIEHRLFSQISRNWAGYPITHLGHPASVHPRHHHVDRSRRPRRLPARQLPHRSDGQ